MSDAWKPTARAVAMGDAAGMVVAQAGGRA